MRLETGNIEKFLETITEERLIALQAHCDDGKLSYTSCSCLTGSTTAKHALGEAGDYCGDLSHMDGTRLLPFAVEAEREFLRLGNPGDGSSAWSDELRRERLMPLLLAEQNRRAQSSTGILDAKQVAGVA